MRDRLRKYRKEDQAEKRFGKDINVSTKDEAPVRKSMTEAETKSVSEAKPGGAKPMAGRSSFGAAFAAARKAGDKTFTWRGKSFTTEMAGEKKSAPAKPAGAAAPAKTQASPAKKAEPVTRASAFAALQEKSKPAPITSAGKAPRLLDRGTKGATPPKRPMFGEDGRLAGTRSAATRAAKLEEIRKAAEAPGASKMAQDRYRMAKQTGMYAKGGKIDGAAIRGKTKIGRK